MAFVLFFLQATAPVIPYIILAGAAGMVFGNFFGFLLAWLGALSGACFVYWLSRTIGQDFFIKLIKKKYSFDLSGIDSKRAFLILFICRIFPVVPTTIINIGSGVSGISFRVFGLSSALGKIPWAIIYVTLGDYFMTSKDFTTTLTIISAILFISFLGINYFRRHINLKK